MGAAIAPGDDRLHGALHVEVAVLQPLLLNAEGWLLDYNYPVKSILTNKDHRTVATAHV